MTNYCIACQLSFGDGEVRHWKVYHRYSEFAELHKLFVKKKNFNLPRMPPKRYFDHGPEVLQERVAGLGDVLEKIVEVAGEDLDLQEFLRPSEDNFPMDLATQMDGARFTF